MICLLCVFFIYFSFCQKLYLLEKLNNKYVLYKSQLFSIVFFQKGEHGGLCRSHRGDLCLWCGYFRAIVHFFAKELHDACAELKETE